jgi:4-amino-4-deoxy-L-arabinose transferase-like glycosyltransferase
MPDPIYADQGGGAPLAPSQAHGTAAWLSATSGGLTRLRPAALEATALAALLAVAGWIFAIPLHAATNYDEGNYLAALTDLRHGFVLGKDVYADQPPGWYGLLRLFASVFGNSVTGVRTGMLIVALVGVLAAWACARPLGALPAFGAAAFLTIAPPYPAQATQIEADTPAAVFALVALAVGIWAFRRPGSRALAVIAGVLIVCAVSIKLSALTILLPFAAIAVMRARLIVWALLGAIVTAGAEALLFRNQLHDITRGVIGQHTSALGNSHWNRRVNVQHLLHFLNWHTPFSWLVLAAVLASLWLAITRRASSLLAALWLFVPAAAAFILAMKPLLDHHLVILALAVAVPAGAALGLGASRLRREAAVPLLLFAALFAVAGTYQQHRQLVRNSKPEPAWVHVAAAWLRAETRPDDVVATDIPVLAYYAHRRLVPDFVDTSFTRLNVGDLKPAEVFAELNRYHVRVAAIGRALWVDPAVRRGFNARFDHRKWHPNIVYYFDTRTP